MGKYEMKSLKIMNTSPIDPKQGEQAVDNGFEPCPFCASTRIVKGNRYFAMCVDCGATGPERIGDKAGIKKLKNDWNIRSTLSKPQGCNTSSVNNGGSIRILNNDGLGLTEELASTKAALELERKKVEELREALSKLINTCCGDPIKKTEQFKIAVEALSHSEPTSEVKL